jgi:hypothetical protein
MLPFAFTLYPLGISAIAMIWLCRIKATDTLCMIHACHGIWNRNHLQVHGLYKPIFTRRSVRRVCGYYALKQGNQTTMTKTAKHWESHMIDSSLASFIMNSHVRF